MYEWIIIYLGVGFMLGVFSLVANRDEVIDEGLATAVGALLWITAMWLPILLLRKYGR